MQKYTRSSRSTTRGSSIEAADVVVVSSGSTVADTTNSRPARHSGAIPEPIRRWHSFHSRRSSFGHSAAPHIPVAGATPPPTTAPHPPPVAKPAARFLSPPPLTPRRRFSVWYHTHTKLLILLCAASSPVFHLLSQSTGSIVVFFCFPLPQMAGAVCRVCLEHLLLFQFEPQLRVCSNQSIVFFTFVVITVLVSGLASASAGRTNASSWSRRKCSS